MRQDRRTEGVNPTEVARCYAEGSSLLALQRRFGVGASTVARWLESMGIPRRAAGSEKHSVAMGVVARRSAAGESAESLGRSMGVSANTIRRRLRDIGMDCGRERGRVWTARGYLCAIGRSGSIEHIHRACWEAHYGHIPAGHCIHHADHDKRNNAIGNLVCLTNPDHLALHRRAGRKP